MSPSQSLIEIWNQVRDSLKKIYSPDYFERWISPIFVRDEGYVPGEPLRLYVSNDFTSDFLQKNFSSDIRNALRVIDPALSFEIVVDENLVEQSFGKEEPTAGVTTIAAPPPVVNHVRKESFGMPLDPNFTFEDFIRGPSNSFAHAAAEQVSENPGCVYNPLLIYGDTGLGKTHLMQAVAHRVHLRDPRARIVYITCEELLNDFIETLRTKNQADFRARYRKVDLLLIDDIQFLSRSEALLEEFFNTFNTLQNERKQIILTSDQSPVKIAGLPERLVSRFQQGLITDIQSPDYATRMAILRSKQMKVSNPIQDEFLNYIAQHITSNVRRLEGALTKLVFYRNLMGKPLTLDIVKDQLRGLVSEDQKAEPTCVDIQRAVAESYDLRLADMTSKERTQHLAFPRQIAMFLCKSFTKNSFPEIGRAFDKNHTTVVHACKAVKARMETDSETRAKIESIVSKLGRSINELE